MSFVCTRMKNDFHNRGWAPTLVLKLKPGGTQKWPIDNLKWEAMCSGLKIMAGQWTMSTLNGILAGQKRHGCQSCRLLLLNNERTFLSVIHNERKCCVSYIIICCYFPSLCPWVLPSPFGRDPRSKMVHLGGFKCFLSGALCSGSRQLHLQFPLYY